MAVTNAKAQRQYNAAVKTAAKAAEQRAKQTAREVSMASKQLQSDLFASAKKSQRQARAVVLRLSSEKLQQVALGGGGSGSVVFTPAVCKRQPRKKVHTDLTT